MIQVMTLHNPFFRPLFIKISFGALTAGWIFLFLSGSKETLSSRVESEISPYFCAIS